MSELYTSLTQLKMALNGGVLPPMTDLTENARKVCDPGLTPGMGGLLEDDEKGLRCPVIGCGGWFHHLTYHLNKTHRGIGGANSIRQVLGIPMTASLMSRRARAAHSARCSGRGPPTGRTRPSDEAYRRAALAHRLTKKSMGYRNLRNTCDAQLASRILAHAERLGRAPKRSDVESGLAHAATIVHGSWRAAVESVGLRVKHCHYTHNDIINAFGEWHARHGRLPNSTEVADPQQSPVLPAFETVLSVLRLRTWREAMDHIGWVLGLDQEKTA